MKVQTDFNQLPLKLNCSSIASSTPGNNISFPQGEIIKFQQFGKQQIQKTDRASIGHKKRLTIQINDSYDFNQSSIDHEVNSLGQQSSEIQQNDFNVHFLKKHQKYQDKSNYCIGESQSPSFSNSNIQIDVNKIISINSFLEQKLKELQTENNILKQTIIQEKSQAKILKGENQTLKTLLKKKQQFIVSQKQKITKMNERIIQLDEKQAEHKFYDQKLRQKEARNQQLQRKLQKITNMNKAFQKQLKQSDKKILQLEKDLQKTFCQNQQDAINRIKQSSVRIKQASLKSKQLASNKENLNINALGSANNMMGSTIQLRKSLDKKKCSQSQGKKKLNPSQPTIKNQRTSSTSNIVSKKLLAIKKQ